MANNERKSGESNKQYLDRIKAQQREQRIQEEIDKVKSREDYGGELEPAALIVEQNPATISQGYQAVGRRNNDHRVGQKSVFGEREYDAHPSLAQRFGNWITDGLHLTSPPTLRDGYNRTLNAEVPTWESAQGQELKRMGKTAMTGAAIVTTPFGLYQFYVNPLAMGAAVGSGLVLDQGVKAGLEVVDNSLNEQGKELTDAQKNAIRVATGFLQGSGAYKWGDTATKRGLEVAMHTSGHQNPLPNIKAGWRQRNLKQRLDVINYILTGKNNNGTSNTLGKITGNEVPYYYTGFWGITKPKYGYDAIRTYLYNEPLLPFKEQINPSLGVHENYVAKNYPNKKIKVYEADNYLPKGKFRPSEEPIHTRSDSEEWDFTVKWGDWNKPRILDHIDEFNAAGHIKETGVLNGEEFTRHQDIWKFNSNDYLKRWFYNKNKLRDILLKWGLDITNYHGNPFIVRTPWVSTNSVSKQSIDQGVMFPNRPFNNALGNSEHKRSIIMSADHSLPSSEFDVSKHFDVYSDSPTIKSDVSKYVDW